jgi:DNA-binding winged helix-turn-helix (wHTH) protein
MDSGQTIEFLPFRLDEGSERLWRGDEPVPLRPKTWQLLRYMAARPGQLLSRDELLDAVWGEISVTVASLNQAVLELRQALGDDAREPRFIETVHRRGFRFVAAVRPVGDDPAPGEDPALPGLSAIEAPGSLHGRDEAIELLENQLGTATAGRRQTVFVTGDAGMGKTSLLRAFGWRHAEDELEGRLHLGWGQCVAGQGEGGESFYPILDALDRLSRREDPGPLLDVLRRFAPAWLARLTGLLPSDEADELRRDLGPVSTTRMLRELCVAAETLAREVPFALVLEDLQWSDPATVELIGMLAERREPARLLVLATYRPVDAALLEHPIAPLRRRLEQRGTARELALEPLSEAAVEGYLRERFDWPEAPPRLATVIQDQTDGNPLFMVTLTEQLLSRKLLTRTEGGWRLEVSPESLVDDAPESLQDLVDDLLRALDADEREALEVASLVGEAFTTQALAAGLGLEPEGVELTCARLARGGRFIEERGVARWPDGTEGRRFGFKHTAVRRILTGRLSPGRRRRLHLRVAKRTEAAHERDPDAQATYLAAHFAEGGDVALVRTDRKVALLKRPPDRVPGCKNSVGHRGISDASRRF